jgi:hypothetical protein
MLRRLSGLALALTLLASTSAASFTFYGSTQLARAFAGVKGVGVKDIDGTNINMVADAWAVYSTPNDPIESLIATTFGASANSAYTNATAISTFPTPAITGQQATTFSESWLYFETDMPLKVEVDVDFAGTTVPFKTTFLIELYDLGGAGLVWEDFYSFGKVDPTIEEEYELNVAPSIYGLRFLTTSATYRSTTLNYNLQVDAVPEPATLAALGLGAMALIRRRRRS